MNDDRVQPFVNYLHVTPIADNTFTATHNNMAFGRAFGGEVFAQGAHCGALSAPGLDLHSMHGYFIRPADVRKQSTWKVHPIRDGRSYASRQITGSQEGNEFFIAHASFARSGPEFYSLYHKPMLPCPGPQECHDVLTVDETTDIPFQFIQTALLPIFINNFDTRYIWLPGSENNTCVAWMRPIVPIPDTALFRQLLIAYLSDFWIYTPTLHIAHQYLTKPPTMASLDHTIRWFYPGDLTDWICIQTETISITNYRQTSHSLIYTSDGNLIAHAIQEGLFAP